MKISNELKVGVLALSAIFVLVWGYSYLKGQDLFSSKKIIYAEYEDVTGLTKSSTVKISGINIGLVTDIKLKDDGSQKVVVEIEVDPSIPIPKNAIAKLVPQSALGGQMIVLDFTGTCEGGDCVQSGDILMGKTVDLLTSMTGDLDPYIEQVQNSWQMVDSMIKGFSSGEGGSKLNVDQTLADFQKILGNLALTTAKLNGIIAQNQANIQSSIKNVDDLTKGLAESNDDIQKTMANISKFSDRLENIELESTVDSTQMTFATVNNSLRTLDGAILDIQKLIKNINEGDGSIGELLNDDAELYNEIKELVQSARILTTDLTLNPERYTRVLSKKRKDLEEPTQKELELLKKIEELQKQLDDE